MWEKFVKMFDEVHEVVGWLGMLLILIAYGSISLDILSAASFKYQLFNVVGAAALVYTALKTRAYPIVALNIVWIAVALYALSTLI